VGKDTTGLILKGISTIGLLAAALVTAHGAAMLSITNMNALDFANAISRGDSGAAQFFLASETRDGTEPVSLEVQAILTRSLKPMPA